MKPAINVSTTKHVTNILFCYGCGKNLNTIFSKSYRNAEKNKLNPGENSLNVYLCPHCKNPSFR